MEMKRFEILEEKIGWLVEAYAGLKNEKSALEQTIALKNTEIQELSEKMARLSTEREKVREKVDGLLNRLEGLLSMEKGSR